MTNEDAEILEGVIIALSVARDTALEAFEPLSDADAMKVYVAAEMAEAAASMLATHIAMQEGPSDEEMDNFLRLVPTPPSEEYDS